MIMKYDQIWPTATATLVNVMIAGLSANNTVFLSVIQADKPSQNVDPIPNGIANFKRSTILKIQFHA